ncbi:DUF547 domain-containing protein [Ekhidna sp.]
MNKTIISLTLILFSFGVFSQNGVSHQSFDELLQKYVDEKGLVNYKGIDSERAKFKAYLTMIEGNSPQKSWTRDQKLAYWINAYNAFTIELILRNYPVESIKDIGAKIKIPFVNTPWDVKFIKIGGEEYDLNNLEHGIIRKDFNEPRIHFALVCAAVSCPKLQNRAYMPEKLDEQLTKAAKDFLADPTKNEFKSDKKAKLSKLFNWYGGDFNNDGTLIEYINQYAPTKLNKDANIDWKDYNWKLNEQ